MRQECPIQRWARATPSAPALVLGAQRSSYQQLDEDVCRWEQALRDRGVLAGDRVGVLAGNRAEWIPLLFATLRLGAALTPWNVRLTEAELLPLLGRLKPKVLLADRGAWAGKLPQARAWEDVEWKGPPGLGVGAAGASIDTDATALLLLTSGTTGAPKAAELTVGNLLASASASGERLGDGQDQRWLGVLPLFHIGGLAMAFRCAAYGATLVLLPRFDAALVNQTLDTEAITHTSLVPTTLQDTLQARAGRPFSGSLRAVLVGGGPAGPELLQRARGMGANVLHTYGLTEACSQVCTEPMGGADGASTGLPLSGIEVRVVDEGRRALPAGAPGEIEVRGPTIMKGYYQDGDATARTLADGWLRTADHGVLDATGCLRVLARRVDLIVSGGENVYPAELEAVLTSHPAVKDAAVLGVPDPRFGEVPVALVVRRQRSLEEEALLAYCRERLASFKVPRRFIWVDFVPRNAAGKADRVKLRGLLAGSAAPQEKQAVNHPLSGPQVGPK